MDLEIGKWENKTKCNPRVKISEIKKIRQMKVVKFSLDMFLRVLLPTCLALLLIYLFSNRASSTSFTPIELKLPSTEVIYDVLVLGSEPEGIIAAVAAARAGAKTALITNDSQLGGLFVLGQMNSLDLRREPVLLQKGLFEEWWEQVGRKSSFDVKLAEFAFKSMLAKAQVEILQNSNIVPLISGNTITGVKASGELYQAKHFIDATADADIAALVGVPFTMGFESLGLNARMVDTLVFRIDNINWQTLQSGVKKRGDSYAHVDDRVAWGHFAEDGKSLIQSYQAQEEGIRLRGLNLGLQDDGSVLVNALLIHGIELFDEQSIEDGFTRAENEAKRIVPYLKDKKVPGFENATFGGVAPKLYIRESRHLETLCTLTVDDVLNNVVTTEDVVAGGYPLDVQVLTPNDTGFVFGVPEVYGARLCVSIPKGVNNLWVVGKAAGYDPLAAASARVVPFGMTIAEAVGIAATRASSESINPKDFAESPENIALLRTELLKQGAYLAEVKVRHPTGPYEHEFFEAYRILRSHGLALGGYKNDPKLNEEIKAIGFIYLLSNVGKRFHNNEILGKKLIANYPDMQTMLTPEIALSATHDSACELRVCPNSTWDALKQAGLAPSNFPPEGNLTRGEAYALAATLATLKGLN